MTDERVEQDCREGCLLLPDDDERHEQFGCVDSDDIAEFRLKSRDYESWARL